LTSAPWHASAHRPGCGEQASTPAWLSCTTRAAPPLQPGDVHVWWLRLDVEPAIQAAMASLLPEGERLMLARSGDDLSHVQRLVARGWRRLVLAAYVPTPAGELRFGSGRSGKPFLLGENAEVRFSLARRGSHALLAVSRTLDVGIDLEATSLGSAPELGEASLREWALHEATVKLHGTGLARAEVDRTPRARWSHVFDIPRAAAAGRTSLIGALACQAAPAHVHWLRAELARTRE
jgi:hypothetical protein